jgi:GDP-4-dehydro-6-deoxy-D-mannose reductase
MTTALVLAANSFVGQYLCRALQRTGKRVVATARRPDNKVATERCDLADRSGLKELLAAVRPEWLFQCAGATATADPQEMYRVHIQGTLNVLGAVAEVCPESTVVLLGSAAEYGVVAPAALPLREDCAPGRLSLFGASKLAQTHLADAAATDWNLRVLVGRPFNVIGPGLPRHYFAGTLAERLLQGKAAGTPGELPVANAHVTRDFLDVRDVAEALVGLVTRATPRAGEMVLYNIASGRETTLLAVAERLCALAGGFRAVDTGPGPSRSRIARSCGDASKLHRAVGWSPRISWEQSIADCWQSLAESAGLHAPPVCDSGMDQGDRSCKGT